jgi:hypothetical protein
MEDLDHIPGCTVRYDDRAGCGVNVAPRAEFVELTFVTRRGFSETHDLTHAQAGELRAVLDASIRTETGPDVEDHHVVVRMRTSG